MVWCLVKHRDNLTFTLVFIWLQHHNAERDLNTVLIMLTIYTRFKVHFIMMTVYL